MRHVRYARHATLVLLFILVVSASALADEVLCDPDPKGYASGVYGIVTVLEPEAAAPRRLQDSDPVFEGSRVTAAENSFALIEMLDGSEVSVDELTQLDLAKAKSGESELDRDVELSLLYGGVRVSVPTGFSPTSVFRVTTPAATVGVRGTDFAVDYESDDEATVDVFDGDVSVTSADGMAPASAGESTRYRRGDATLKEKLSGERGARWEQCRESMNLHWQESAERGLRERFDTLRAQDPNHPALARLRDKYREFAQTKGECMSRIQALQEITKDRRAGRVASMKKFAEKRGKATFDKPRRFAGEAWAAWTPDQRRAALEKLQNRRKAMREKAAERIKERLKEIREKRKDKKLKDDNGGTQSKPEKSKETVKPNREKRKETIQNRREKTREKRGKQTGKAPKRRKIK